MTRVASCPHCGHRFELCGVYVRGLHPGRWERCDRPKDHDGDHKTGDRARWGCER